MFQMLLFHSRQGEHEPPLESPQSALPAWHIIHRNDLDGLVKLMVNQARPKLIKKKIIPN